MNNTNTNILEMTEVRRHDIIMMKNSHIFYYSDKTVWQYSVGFLIKTNPEDRNCKIRSIKKN